jgi:ribosome-binding factor A
MSERTARLDELLREEISAIIGREIADPRVGFVTVTSVDVAPDLAHATVWVSVIGDPQARRQSVRALGRAMPFVRHRLGSLRLKRIPELHVREDDTAERGTRVLRILEELEHGDAPAEAPAETPVVLPMPAPLRGVPEPRPVGRRRSSPKRAGQRGH